LLYSRPYAKISNSTDENYWKFVRRKNTQLKTGRYKIYNLTAGTATGARYDVKFTVGVSCRL
jgi:hypothetical protein